MASTGSAWNATPARSDVRFIGDLMGSYVLASRAQQVAGLKKFACRARSISAREAVLMAPVIGQPGEAVTVAFPDLGILRGSVVRQFVGGFAVEIHATEAERALLNSRILWLKRKALKTVDDRREHRRVLPRVPHATLFLADGQSIPGLVIDMSRSGVAISADVIVPNGTPVAVGAVPGKVVRPIEAGFAVQFDELQAIDQLEALLTARAATAETEGA